MNDRGWASPSNSCVRNYLLDAHKSINATFRGEMRQMKAKLCNDVSFSVYQLTLSCFAIPNILSGRKKIGFPSPTKYTLVPIVTVAVLKVRPLTGLGKR
jgi:hypothetical protein